MLVSIILPTVRTTSVGAAIDAVLRQTDEHWELIVVYQGDDHDLETLLKGYGASDERISAHHADRSNLSHARNVGMNAARGDVLAFTDDDCEVAPDWVAVIRETFGAHPEIEVLGGEVVPEPNRQRWRISTCPSAQVIDALYIPGERDEAPPGFYMIGANFCVRSVLAERVGPFDEVLGAGAEFACCEDQDFLFRAEALGAGMMTSRRLIVDHTSGRRYGIRQFVRHQRNYARGRGAWVAKLRVWGHPLGHMWSQAPGAAHDAKQLFRRPHRWVFDRFAGYHSRRAAAEYLERYAVNDRVLSVARDPAAGEV